MRRLSRELAMQFLFQLEFAPQIELKEFLTLYEHSMDLDHESLQYAQELIGGVQQSQKKIDQMLTDSSQHWRLDRMALVDKNILRMAAFEMKFASEPLKPQIAIDEAIELAKKYGSQDSKAFINGVLDHISKKATA